MSRPRVRVDLRERPRRREREGDAQHAERVQGTPSQDLDEEAQHSDLS